MAIKLLQIIVSCKYTVQCISWMVIISNACPCQIISYFICALLHCKLLKGVEGSWREGKLNGFWVNVPPLSLSFCWLQTVYLNGQNFRLEHPFLKRFDWWRSRKALCFEKIVCGSKRQWWKMGSISRGYMKTIRLQLQRYFLTLLIIITTAEGPISSICSKKGMFHGIWYSAFKE